MNNNVVFKNNVPYRGLFVITEWCVLGDCNQPECHHCYHVKGCKKHQECIDNGTCTFIPIPTNNKFDKNNKCNTLIKKIINKIK